MTILNEAIEKVMDLIDALNLFSPIHRGAMTTADDLAGEIGPTTPESVWLNKHKYIPVDLTINGKHTNLETLTDALNTIDYALTMATEYPSGEGWQIVDITTLTEPQVIGREDNGQWMMAAALLVKVATEPVESAPEETPEADPEPLPIPEPDQEDDPAQDGE